MGRKTTKPLGAELRLREINRVVDKVYRLGGILENADEEARTLNEAFGRLDAAGKQSSLKMREELYRLVQSGTWLLTLLGGCKEDIQFIKSHLNCIITLLQLEAAKRLDEKEGGKE